MNYLDILVQVQAETTGEDPEVIRASLTAYLRKRSPKPEFYKDLDPAEAAETRRMLVQAFAVLAASAKNDPDGFRKFVEKQGSPMDMLKASEQFASHKLKQLTRHATSEAVAITRGWFRDIGQFWWEHSFKHCSVDDVVGGLRAIFSFIETARPSRPEWAERTYLYLQLREGQILTAAAARWAHFAFPVVQYSSHRYVAALVSTAIPKELPVSPPWKAFLLELPSDFLFTGHDAAADDPLRYVLVSQYRVTRIGEEVETEVWDISSYSAGGVALHMYGKTLDDLRRGETDVDNSESAFAMEFTDRDQRTNFLLCRLVVNTCLAMSRPDDVKKVGSHPKTEPVGPPRQNKEPTYRVYRVGRPIELDCRPALTAYLDGVKRGPLTVQFLVRGHWRQQACGVGLSDRRTIWIEPYWKGPDDAPINVREHIL